MWHVPGLSNLYLKLSFVSKPPERNSPVSLMTLCGSSSTWDRVQLRGAQTGEQLLRQIEFGRLRQMGDIARVDDQCGLLGHPIHDIDGLGQGAGDVRIRLLVETDMRVADLHPGQAALRVG
jgi:hypothetical protein